MTPTDGRAEQLSRLFSEKVRFASAALGGNEILAQWIGVSRSEITR